MGFVRGGYFVYDSFNIHRKRNGVKSFSLKEGIKHEDLESMTPKLLIAFGYLLSFAKQYDLPVVVTNIKHKFEFSKSDTHPEGRAVDISTRGWTRDKIRQCEEYLETAIGNLGAISHRTGMPNLVYWHEVVSDGVSYGAHFHVQVSP